MVEEKIEMLFGTEISSIIKEYCTDYLDLSTAKIRNRTGVNSDLMSINILSILDEKPHTIILHKGKNNIYITDQEENSHKRCSINISNKETIITTTGYKENSGRLIYEPERYNNLLMFYDIKKCKDLFDKKINRTDNSSFFQDALITANEKYGIDPTDIITVSVDNPIHTMITYTKDQIMELKKAKKR